MEVHEHHNIQPDPGPIAHIPANHHAEAVPDQPSCPFCFDAITTENLTTLGGCVCGVQLCITCAHDMRTNGLYNCPLCRRGISHMFNGTTIIPLEVQYFNVVTGVDNFNIEGFSSHSTNTTFGFLLTMYGHFFEFRSMANQQSSLKFYFRNQRVYDDTPLNIYKKWKFTEIVEVSFSMTLRFQYVGTSGPAYTVDICGFSRKILNSRDWHGQFIDLVPQSHLIILSRTLYFSHNGMAIDIFNCKAVDFYNSPLPIIVSDHE